MPHLLAEMPEAANAATPRLLQQDSLIERLIRGRLGLRTGQPGHVREVRKPNLATGHGLQALWHFRHLLAHPDAVRRGAARHVAVVPDPVDWTRRTLAVPLVGDRERGSRLGEVELA